MTQSCEGSRHHESENEEGLAHSHGYSKKRKLNLLTAAYLCVENALHHSHGRYGEEHSSLEQDPRPIALTAPVGSDKAQGRLDDG